jgi:P27 family predicted phage terminase small subunit
MKRAPIPRVLSAEARKRWRKLAGEYSIEDQGGLAVLQAHCEAYDRMCECQRQIRKDGATFLDRWGQVRAHPLLAAERDSRAAMLACLKQLCLDLEPLHDRAGRPGGS